MSTDLGRSASLRIHKLDDGPVLKATVPVDLSADEFVKITQRGYDLISRLTGCNCLSGRISFVIEEDWAETLRVEL